MQQVSFNYPQIVLNHECTSTHFIGMGRYVMIDTDELRTMFEHCSRNIHDMMEPVLIIAVSTFTHSNGMRFMRFLFEDGHLTFAYTDEPELANIKMVMLSIYEHVAPLESLNKSETQLFQEEIKLNEFTYKGNKYSKDFDTQFHETLYTIDDESSKTVHVIGQFSRKLADKTTEYLTLSHEKNDEVIGCYTIGIEIPISLITII